MSIDQLLIKDTFETNKEFLLRSELTHKINNANLSLNALTCVTLARLYINKVKLGVSYDEEVEAILAKISSMIQ